MMNMMNAQCYQLPLVDRNLSKFFESVLKVSDLLISFVLS